MKTWVTIDDMLKAANEKKLWALSRGEQRRVVVADDEVAAKVQVEGSGWTCELLEGKFGYG